VARAALERTESRGGHTRDDHPEMDRTWRSINLYCSLTDAGAGAGAGAGAVEVARRPNPPIRADLLELFSAEELAKYLTEAELPAAVPAAAAETGAES
jgi:succinate dehydrogenase / fumarate reductase flavoprotein subunit